MSNFVLWLMSMILLYINMITISLVVYYFWFYFYTLSQPGLLRRVRVGLTTWHVKKKIVDAQLTKMYNSTLT